MIPCPFICCIEHFKCICAGRNV